MLVELPIEIMLRQIRGVAAKELVLLKCNS